MRKYARTMTETEMTPDRIKLKQKGYTLEAAATILGVHYTHLLRVLNGERVSKRLLNNARALPKLNGKGAV